MIQIFHPQERIAEAISLVLSCKGKVGFQSEWQEFVHVCRQPETEWAVFFEASSLETAELALELLRFNNSPPRLLVFCFSSPKKFTSLVQDFFPELPALKEGGLICLLQLPYQLAKIQEIFKNGKDEEKTKAALVSLDLRLAEYWDISTRHQLGNIQAAARILHGAFRSGDYDFSCDETRKKALDLYRKLLKNDTGISDCKRHKLYSELEEYLNSWRSSGAVSGGQWWQSDEKILVIDDQAEIWEPVWEFILPGKVKIIKELTGENIVCHCVLLDLNLGQVDYNGLVILQLLKKSYFELPVVIMSHYDHAELTKRCLASGADGYFIKELPTGQRDSVEYFRSLKELIAGLPDADAPARKIWRQFKAVEDRIEAADQKYETSIGSLFRKAYYFFILDQNRFPAAKLLIPWWLDNGDVSMHYNSVASCALQAADEILIACLCARGQMEYGQDQVREYLYESLEDSPRQRPCFSVRYKRAILEDLGADDYRNLRFFAPTSRHAGEKPVDTVKAEGCLLELIALANTLLPKIGGVSGHSYVAVDPELQWSQNLRFDDFVSVSASLSDNHGAIGRIGAECFKEGLNDYEPETTCSPICNLSVLFLDDEGQEGSWYQALVAFFEKHNVSLEICSEYHETIDLGAYALVLLDLDFCGNSRQGLSYLRQIKEKDISLPVIMLTADASGFSARKCLLAGADDYFVKTTSVNSLDYIRQFEKMVVPLLVQAATSCRRSWWQCVDAFTKHVKCLESLNVTCKLAEEIYDYHKKKGKVNAYDGKENRMLAQYLRESFFHYLVALGSQVTETCRVRTLLATGSSPVEDALLCLAKFVELATVMQAFVGERSNLLQANTTGGLIDDVCFDQSHAQLFKNIWNCRVGLRGNPDKFTLAKLEGIYMKFEEILPLFKFNLPRCRIAN